MFRSLGEGLICSPDFSQDKQWLCSQLRKELAVNALLTEAIENYMETERNINPEEESYSHMEFRHTLEAASALGAGSTK